jgi:hypothetical protein
VRVREAHRLWRTWERRGRTQSQLLRGFLRRGEIRPPWLKALKGQRGNEGGFELGPLLERRWHVRAVEGGKDVAARQQAPAPEQGRHRSEH